MATGEINSSSFEFYEGLRVLVPGAMAVGLYVAITGTFDIASGHLGANTLSAIVVGLLFGLLLLFLDVPSAAAVTAFDSPLALLDYWAQTGVRPAPRGARRLNVYYEILDAEIPTGIRNRTYYLGVMYRIGFEAIFLAALSLAVLTTALVFPNFGTPRPEMDKGTLRLILFLFAAVHIGVIAYVARARYIEHRAKGRPNPGVRLKEDITKEIPKRDQLLLAAGLTAAISYAIAGLRWAGAVGVGVPLILWGYRYVRGVPREGTEAATQSTALSAESRELEPEWPQRQNLHGVTGACLYAAAAVSVLVIGGIRPPGISPLSTAVALGWCSLSLVPTLLLGFRNHEKRLLGSYGIQRTWLRRNQEMLIKKGYFVREEPPVESGSTI